MDKIATIRSKFPDKVDNIPLVQKPEIGSEMNPFEPATEDEIKKLFLSSLLKSCNLDPIPTSVLKNCLDILVTPITDIINILMDTSTFLKKFKEPHVRPLLKKTSLPKQTEKLQACILLESHFQNLRKGSSRSAVSSYKNSHLSNPLQSAYRNTILQNQLYWKYLTI